MCSIVAIQYKRNIFHCAMNFWMYFVIAVITFIPKHGHTPGRYLVTLNKLDTVKELRQAVVKVVYGNGLPEDKQLVLAEGLDHHISRFLVSSHTDTAHRKSFQDMQKKFYS